jgi:hypothetical protein
MQFQRYAGILGGKTGHLGFAMRLSKSVSCMV